MNQGLLAILAFDHFGVLGKIVGLFSRRGFNIKSISAGEIQEDNTFRITILADGGSLQLEQVCQQVRKLEDVLSAKLLTGPLVERELVLIKVCPSGDDLGDLMQMVTHFAAKSSSASGGCAIIEATGTTQVIDDLVSKAERFHIVEMSRTGITALEQNDIGLTGQHK